MNDNLKLKLDKYYQVYGQTNYFHPTECDGYVYIGTMLVTNHNETSIRYKVRVPVSSQMVEISTDDWNERIHFIGCVAKTQIDLRV